MELRQLLRTLARRWKFVTLSFLLGIGAAVGLTSLMTPQYQSEARIYIASSSAGTLDAYNLGIYSAQRVASYADLATDPTVLERVVDRLDLDLTPEELAGQVTAAAVPNTVILQVRVVNADPELARDIALAESTEIIDLVANLETSAGEEAAPIVARLAGEPSVDDAPVSPNAPLNIVVGAMLGLILGVVGAVLRDMFDTSVDSADELAELSGSAVMSVVPFDSSVPAHPLISDRAGSPERVEAFRVLRTNLQFVDLDSDKQMIMIASAMPGEGKTVTATNLAISLVSTGRSVLLIDCDFRRPRVAQILGLENAVGLLTALVGKATLADCIQQHSSGVDFLATGPKPPNPAEVLGTRAMQDMLATVRDRYDVVIIDAPPLLPVADPAIIAGLVDAVLLVTRHGSTSREMVLQSIARLEPVGVRVAGVVLNMAPRRAIARFGYGYGYGYGDEETAVELKPAKVQRGSRRAGRAANRHSQTDSVR